MMRARARARRDARASARARATTNDESSQRWTRAQHIQTRRASRASARGASARGRRA